ncbi:MAG: hypothetical protein KC434_06985 [Anaerolineales bacterium]|nr:hypothetical protein [Anaerolineales bacterium]
MHANDTGAVAPAPVPMDTPTPSPGQTETTRQTLIRIMPDLLSGFAWLIWFTFLLLPVLFDLHGVAAFDVTGNVTFILTGLVLVLASSTALTEAHLIRSGLFAGVVFVLAWWF